MRSSAAPLVCTAALLCCCSWACAGEVDRAPGRVNNLKVLSDKVDDVTTVENIVGSFTRPGMTDQERAEALWRAVVKYRHQTIPANELLAADWESHDPVKIFNVYGYCMCCCCSAVVEALNRADGREARGRILTGHSVPEVRYGDGWHMFDASLITVFPRPKDKTFASVDEIAEAVKAWYAAHPDYRGKPARLLELMRSQQWTGWKTQGPELLAACPFYNQGYLPARTHGWDATMSEYDRKSEVYEYGYQVGHRALLSLRPGEAFIREAGNRGLHLEMDRRPDWDMLRARAPQNDLVYLKDAMPGYNGGVVGNGTHRYAPELAAGDLAAGAEVYVNLATGAGSPALHVREGGKPGVAIIALASPYVYLGGRLSVKAVRRSADDRVAISISTNNGGSFQPLWSAGSLGLNEATIDLGPRILRRYAYWLTVEVQSRSPGDAGLDSLVVENDIQHAPRTLAWLGKGANTIRVEADGSPALATRTVACRIVPPDSKFQGNETTTTMGVQFENLDVRDGSCWWTRGAGTMTVPVDVPGDLVALRWSAQVRARGARDLIKMLVSTDGGKSWTQAGQMAGPTPGATQVFRYDALPAGARRALLRFELSGNNTIGIMSFRLDADYRDPLAAPAPRPLVVEHRWSEKGQQRVHTERVAGLPYRYTIEAAADAEPEMVSVSIRMPSAGEPQPPVVTLPGR